LSSNSREFESVAAQYAATLAAAAQPPGRDWTTLDWSSGKIHWKFFRSSALPRQGWKVHVSAATVEACLVCSRVLPVLYELGASFKIPGRLEDFIYINSGDAGIAQLGKIITVYPRDDAHAVEIVRRLNRIWPTSQGPEVQTDLHVEPGSAVSLRFGLYEPGPIVVSSTGIYDFALLAPDGQLIADARSPDGRQSAAAPSPPLACVPPRQIPAKLGQPLWIGDRQYVPLALLRSTPRSKTFLGLGMDSLDTVILKIGYPGVAGDHRGADVRRRMRKEHAILTALSAHRGLAPRAVDSSDAEWPILVMEDCRGPLLSELPRAQRMQALPALARAVARLHAAGFVHGDIKLENAVWRPPEVALLDFELAEKAGDVIGSGGTPGFTAPEVRRDARAAFSRDVFALGGCLVQSILDVPPGLLAEGSGRWRGLLSLEGAAAASGLIGQLTAIEPAARPDTQTASSAIAGVLEDRCDIRPAFGSAVDHHERNWSLRASIDAASMVRDYSHAESGASCWRNEHFMKLFDCEGINLGAAGIILGLASVDQALARNDFAGDIDVGARWLASRPAGCGASGLFTGDAGVALALAVAGRRLANPGYIKASRRRLESAAMDGREIDLFSGSAGAIFASCLIHHIVGEEWPLELGLAAARQLQALFRQDDRIPLWAGAEERDPYLGCAHGSAGIAMALASLGVLTGNPAQVEIGLRTFQQLFAHGKTSGGSALRLTLKTDRAHAAGSWCHGVAGYLWCILQGLGDHPELREIIDWAVEAVRDSMTAGTPTYCHGLAGRLELWSMLSPIPRHRQVAIAQAGKTVRALRLLHHKRHGKITWCSDDPEVTTPDLWIGFLGPATALAMHAQGFATALLSAQWLAACANGSVASEQQR
jgi:hypothetical protein